MSDFVVNGALFYKAQQNLGSALSLFENNRSNITKCKDTISNTYEYKKKVSEVCNNLLFLINDVSLLNRNISDAKERLISLNPGFAAEYYDAASKKYDNLHGRLTQEEKNITQYNQEQYQRNLCKYLENLEAQGLMTDELRKVYEQVKLSVYVSSLSHELEKMDPNSAEYRQSRKWYDSNCQKLLNLQIKELESKGNLTEAEQKQLDDLKYAVKAIDLEKMQLELEEMNRNPVKNPDTPGNGRIPYDQIEAYRKECEKYGKYYQKKLKLEQDIEAMQRELGVYQNKWYEDFGEAATKTGAAWAKAFQSGNIDDFKSAFSQTSATCAVVATSVFSGLLKVGEHFVDLRVLGYDLIRSVGSYLQGDEESAKKIMDGSLDFVRRDLVGEANQNFYKDTPLGNWINENSNLKYDSAGAKAIQNAGELATKVVIATAATVATGGAGAVVIGAFYGGGKAAEDYAQSVDRKHGESYNYTEAALRVTVGGISGAAEFYGYGQIGAGALGVKIPSNASTSFAKNFFAKDTLLDTASVVSDHVVNAICGDETWQEALLYGGTETVLALGMNAIGARQATKAARAAEAAEDAARAVKQLEVDFDNPLEYNKYLDSLTPEQKTKFMTDYYNNGSMFSTSDYTDYFKKNFVPEVPVEKYYKYSEAYLNPKYYDVKSKTFLWPNAEGANQFIHLTDEEFLKLANEEGIEGLKKLGAEEVTFEELKKEGLTRATWKSNVSDDVYGEYFGSPSTKGMNDVDHRVLGPDTSYTITDGDGNIYKMTIDEPLISTTLYDVDGFSELKIGPGTEYEVRIMKTQTADWFGQKGGADQYAFYVTDKNGKILTKNTANGPQAYKLSRGKLEEMGIIRSIG